jgi:hypothetical protein
MSKKKVMMQKMIEEVMMQKIIEYDKEEEIR